MTWVKNGHTCSPARETATALLERKPRPSDADIDRIEQGAVAFLGQAQALFCLMVSIAIFTYADGTRADSRARRPERDRRHPSRRGIPVPVRPLSHAAYSTGCAP